MKVGMVVNDLSGGGAERALVLLARHLVEDGGLDVTVFTLEDRYSDYPLPKGVERVVLPGYRLSRGVGRALLMPLQAASLAAIARKRNIDVLVSFLLRSNAAAVLATRFGWHGDAYVYEQIDPRMNYEGSTLSSRYSRALIRSLYPKAKKVLAASAGVRDALQGLGISDEHMFVLHNPIDDVEIGARSPRTGVSSPFRILTVGRLVPQKDHVTLLHAFALVAERVPAELTVLGEGPLRNALEALTEELGLSKQVRFPGWVANPYAAMRDADLFVLSSRYEGFGIVLAEALAHGLPVVSTDCPSGPREVLSDGLAGVLVPVGDPTAMAEAILDLWGDEHQYAAYSKRGLESAHRFSLASRGRQLMSILGAEG